jgi:hypothetical protein
MEQLPAYGNGYISLCVQCDLDTNPLTSVDTHTCEVHIPVQRHATFALAGLPLEDGLHHPGPHHPVGEVQLLPGCNVYYPALPLLISAHPIPVLP